MTNNEILKLFISTDFLEYTQTVGGKMVSKNFIERMLVGISDDHTDKYLEYTSFIEIYCDNYFPEYNSLFKTQELTPISLPTER